MERVKDVTVPKVSVSEWQKFKKKCKEKGLSIYYVVNFLIKEFNKK
jgi:hypothetical protein